MIPILSGNVASALPSGYDVANSSRWDNASSMKMTRTPSSDGNLDRWTWSFWIKLGKIGTEYVVFHAYGAVGSTETFVKILSGSAIEFSLRVSGTYEGRLITNRLLRDPSGWMHLCFVMDTPNSTSGDRMIIYVNGVRETSFSTETYPDQNQDSTINDASFEHTIGSYGSGNYFDGYMAEVVLLDGTAAAVTDFGEFDSDSPTIWKPKDPSGLTFGTNGFYLDFKDSSNLGNDANGGQDWTEVNFDATDQATDTCTNNFCTMNPLDFTPTTFAQGNLKLNFAQSPNVFGITTGTLFMGSGKYYFEAKITSPDSSTGIQVGVIQVEPYLSRLTAPGVDLSLFFGLGARFITTGGVHKVLNGTDSSISDSWSNDDIIRIAYDGSAGKIYMFNGTSELTGQDFSAGTSFNNGTLTPGTMVLPYTSLGDGGSGTKTAQVEWNFGGCPSFSISSGNTDANGYGNFEYSVPSGYYALNSKNLAEFG